MAKAKTNESGFIPALRYDRLTPAFDAVVALTVRDRTVKRRVIAHAGIGTGESVLDVGCGTGTLAIAAAKAAPGVAASGLDADPTILARAKSKAEEAGVKVEFAEGRSDALPYEDASFDLVLSTLFFHHLPDDAKRRSAAELVRVLRPGGRAVIGDWGRPHDVVMRGIMRATVQLLDGTETTALNVRGELPGLLCAAGLTGVAVDERLRTPSGSYEIITGAKPESP